MCGFTGFLTPEWPADPQELAKRMCDKIRHRGPDDEGYWSDADAGIMLGHRRLSILDLSSAGHQPMVSHGGRFVMAFNGEIYNYKSLRSAVESQGQVQWRGHSDTETALEYMELFSVEALLRESVGMFAISVWDRKERVLTLARDRMGEKPLYYGFSGRSLLFGSELKSLREFPGFDQSLSSEAISLFLRHNYVPAPHSIYRSIKKLQPGTLARFTVGSREGEHKPYWRLQDCLEQEKIGSKEEALEELDRRVREAVSLQMVADVPVGAFLSGGYDSSLITGVMQSLSSRPVNTYSIGFSEASHNEAVHAKAVASHLGTDHTELYVSTSEAQSVIPKLPEIYDEPFADSSQIPTFLVSKLASEHVTVALSGDAGDELFGGYNRYFLGAGLWSKLSRVPRPLRRVAGSVMDGMVPVVEWADRLSDWPQKISGLRLPADKFSKGARALRSADGVDLYRILITHWAEDDPIFRGPESPINLFKTPGLSLEESMMAWDSLNYLPDDILVKVDRAAMAVSLETRVPLLDHRLVEFAWRLPLPHRISGRTGKVVLRELAHKYVPREMLERPKMGFGVPIQSWLRGDLRDWAEALMTTSNLEEVGLNASRVKDAWDQHVSRRRDWHYHLWDVLMLLAWKDAQ